jgi:hypothetical protein
MIIVAALMPAANLRAEDTPAVTEPDGHTSWLSMDPTSGLTLAGDEHHAAGGGDAHAGHDAPDAHAHHNHFHYAPIGVMGSHMHGKGDVMFSYRSSFMQMRGNREGDRRMSTSKVLQDYMVAPTEMSMQMDMFGVMYGLTDDLTLMAMLPYTRMSMKHRNRMGVRFSTKSEGLGDVSLTSLWKIGEWLSEPVKHHLHIGAGVGFPTGSINKKDDTPAGADRKLPYPMQLGSGTYDLLPSVTYTGQCKRWSWGAQARASVRLGENSNDYRLGDRLLGTVWADRKLTDWLSTSVRLEGQTWGDIDGADPDLMPMMVPTADPDRRGGTRMDACFGLSIEGPDGLLSGHRFDVEFCLPVYQRLGGPQLEADWRVIFGWRFSF